MMLSGRSAVAIEAIPRPYFFPLSVTGRIDMSLCNYLIYK
jgi:hypothetical protein